MIIIGLAGDPLADKALARSSQVLAQISVFQKTEPAAAERSTPGPNAPGDR